MGKPINYLPKKGSGIYFRDSAIYKVTSLGSKVPSSVVEKTSDLIGDWTGKAINIAGLPGIGSILGDQVGNIIGDLLSHFVEYFSTKNAGPESKRSAVLLKVPLPSNSYIECGNLIEDMIKDPSGVQKTGALLFIRDKGKWQGPFNPRHDFGHCLFKEVGHTGIVGGPVIIQSEFCQWGNYRDLDVQMRVFFELH